MLLFCSPFVRFTNVQNLWFIAVFRAKLFGEIHSFEKMPTMWQYLLMSGVLKTCYISVSLPQIILPSPPTSDGKKEYASKSWFYFANFKAEIVNHPRRHPFYPEIRKYINLKQEIRVPTGNGRQSMRREADGQRVKKGTLLLCATWQGRHQTCTSDPYTRKHTAHDIKSLTEQVWREKRQSANFVDEACRMSLCMSSCGSSSWRLNLGCHVLGCHRCQVALSRHVDTNCNDCVPHKTKNYIYNELGHVIRHG